MNFFIHATNEAIKCITFPYACSLVISILILFIAEKKKAVACLGIIIFMLLWRSSIFILSSRYCASFILVALLISAYARTKITRSPQHTILLFCIFAFFLSFNLIKCFSSFRNNYIFDLKEDVSSFISQSENTFALIESNEFNRLKTKNYSNRQQKLVADDGIHETLNRIYSQYDFWNKDAILLFRPHKGLPLSDISNCIYNKKAKYKQIRKYYTNKKKSNYFSVVYQEKFYPESFQKLKTLDSPIVKEVLNNGILKSCYPQYDVYIYQLKNKLYWIIGADIEENTSILMHVYTDCPDLLPPKRIKHKFDNLDFLVLKKNEIDHISNYKIYSRTIPQNYPISYIKVGFNMSGKEIWFKSISLLNDKYPPETATFQLGN